MSRVVTQPASASGEFAVRGDLPVVRLGYGSMQIPGPGVWGRRATAPRPSACSAPEVQAARAITPIATVQNLYNLADRSAEPVLDYCEREAIGFIPWFPMATGRLAAPGGPLQRIADEHAVTADQLALAWLLQRSSVLLPIPGTSTVAHLEGNLGAALIELTPDQVQQLDAAGRRRSKEGHQEVQ